MQPFEKLRTMPVSAFLEILKKKYQVTFKKDSEQLSQLSKISERHRATLQLILAHIYKINPQLFNPENQAFDTIKRLISITVRFDAEYLYSSLIQKESSLLYLRNIKHFQQLTDLILNLTTQEAFNHFLTLLAQYACFIKFKYSFFEDLKPLTGQPKNVKLLLCISKKVSSLFLKDYLKDLLTKDDLSLYYILESITILESSKLQHLQKSFLEDCTNQYQKEKNLTAAYHKNLYTKPTLFVRLCLLKSLMPAENQTNLLNEDNIEKIFNLNNHQENKIKSNGTKNIQIFFNQLIVNTLTQRELNQLVDDFKECRLEKQKSLFGHSVVMIRKMKFFPIEMLCRLGVF